MYKSSLFTISLVKSYGPIAGMLFIPALPILAKYFSVSPFVAQLIVLLYFLGYTLGQLFYIPMMRRYTPAHAIYGGMSLAMAGILFCILSIPLYEFPLMLLGRFLTGLGASICPAICNVLLIHYRSEDELIQGVTRISEHFAFGLGVSTLLGGYLTLYCGWLSCFYLLALYTAMLATFASWLPMINLRGDCDVVNPKKSVPDVQQCKKQILVLSAIIRGLHWAFTYGFAIFAPFITSHLFHFNAGQYGLWGVLPALGMLVGAYCVLQWYTSALLLKVRIVSAVVIGICALAMPVCLMMRQISPLSLFLPIAIINLSVPSGLTYKNVAYHFMSASDQLDASRIMGFIEQATSLLAITIIWLIQCSFPVRLSVFYIVVGGIVSLSTIALHQLTDSSLLMSQKQER